LILNKIDLVEEHHLEALTEKLREIEPDAPMITCERGDVDPRVLFPPDLAECDRTGPAPAALAHHHEQFATREWQVAAGIGLDELERSLQEPGLLRAKGFVETAEGVRLVQVVGRRVEFSEPEQEPDPELLGRVVMIRRVE
jgi:G3E family GTPase